ncbi:MAG: hypothetical protein FJ087_13615 [Deltaproteobacteria bacterium]|nr:hypothetical protein [Deltaproteobacteria bacterium]
MRTGNRDASGEVWRRASREALRYLARAYRHVPEADREDAVSAATLYQWTNPPAGEVPLGAVLTRRSRDRLFNALEHERLVAAHAAEAAAAAAAVAAAVAAAAQAFATPPTDPPATADGDPFQAVCLREAIRIAETAPDIPEASRDTLGGLLSGLSLDAIAAGRGVSLDRVRKQADRGAAALALVLRADGHGRDHADDRVTRSAGRRPVAPIPPPSTPGAYRAGDAGQVGR